MRFRDDKSRVAWLTFLVGVGLLVAWYALKSLGDIFSWLGAAYGFLLGILMPFLIAILLAYLLEPIVDGLQKLILIFRRDNSRPAGKLSRFIALGIFLLLLFGLLSLGSLYFFPALVRNIVDVARNLPEWIDEIGTWIDEMIVRFPVLRGIDVNTLIQGITSRFQETALSMSGVTGQIFSWGRSFGNGLISLGMGFIVMIFLLYDKKSIVGEFSRLAGAIMKPDRFARASRRMGEISHILNDYLRGRVVESALLGALCLIGCSIAGSRFAVLIAVMVGLLNLVPYVGSMFSFLIALLITLLDNSALVLPVGIIILLAQALDNAILIPLIIGDSVGLSPIWILLATALFGKLLGVVGMLLAPPIMAILFLFVDDYVQKKSGGQRINIVKQSVLFRRGKKKTGT